VERLKPLEIFRSCCLVEAFMGFSAESRSKMEDRNFRFSILILMMLLMVMAAAVLAMAEDQRLNHHRHRLGVGKLLADVDEIKVTEIDAVDGNNPSAW
jgi:hypothetical protein